MTGATIALIAVCVLLADVAFAVLAHFHERAVHAREAAFRLRAEQSATVSDQPHGERI